MIQRHLSQLVVSSLQDFPVVLVVGARQVGKSTLVQAIAGSEWDARYFTLDDRTVLDAALTNPDGFLNEIKQPAIIDEIQKAPDMLRAIKLLVDRQRKPGMFLITGSANILTLSKVSESLAGRVAVYELNPFSWPELNGSPAPTSIDDLFGARKSGDLLKFWPGASRAGRLQEIQTFILSGGFPTPSLMDSERSRRLWFESYRQTYIERDLRDITNITNLPDFGRLMRTLALRTGQMLNISELSRDIGLPVSTLRRYFHILTQTYQASIVPPFFANVGKRLVKTPKAYMADTGLACHLSASDRWETLVGQNRVGPMVETWVMTEIKKMIAVSSRPAELLYWRTSTGQEVDFLLERGGDVVGIEVKWGAGIQEKDLSGMVACRQALGKRWRMGALLHGGTETVPIDEKTIAVPFGVFFGRDR
jgi:hypothetical protein